MDQKNKQKYKIVTGKYQSKAGDLEFGYEYTTGNRLSRKGRKDTKQNN
ncbi:hypothetical protein [Oceanobacillus halotolerans]|nr:hypothetical protein [Oceanobacillus halotolerans]